MQGHQSFYDFEDNHGAQLAVILAHASNVPYGLIRAALCLMP
jgi:hypothetical protein